MEMEPQERESENGEESPMSQNGEDISDGEGSPHEDQDSCDEMGRPGMIADNGDVLAKLKMQVRDIKVGEDFENRGINYSRGHPPDGFALPVQFAFTHPGAFMSPMAPQPAAPSSGSSHSSEGSASSHTWSFEEQFKQLYEINDDPRRKEFLDDLFSFMQKRGTPINRLPIMAKSVLDLYELFNLVIARGGLVDVINKKLWQEIIKGLHLPSSITSAAFTLRTQYMKYLYPYEAEKKQLSTNAELQAAIDGNRREGRRSSYGQYDSIQRSPSNPPHQLPNPLALISQQQQQLAARMTSVIGTGLNLHNGVHLNHPQPISQPLNGGPLSHLNSSEFENKMYEYMRLINKEMHIQFTSPTREESSPDAPSPPTNPLEMQRTLWNLYNNNNHQHQNQEPQRMPLNLSEPAVQCKRENESVQSNNKKVKAAPEIEEEAKEQMEQPEQESNQESTTNPITFATNIQIRSRGNPRNGDVSLVVSVEASGVKYEGILFAKSSS